MNAKPPTTTQRFVFSEGTSHKFWEVHQDGSSVNVRFGRIGTDGQQSVRREASPAAAAAAIAKLIREKRNKGYRADGSGSGSGSGSKAQGNANANGNAKAPAKAPAKKASKTPGATVAPAGNPSAAGALPPGIPATRPVRNESLMCLSGLGQIAVELDDARPYLDRARYIDADTPSKALLKIRRLHKLEMGGNIPPWFGQLRHLRSLVCAGSFKKLPPVLATLPHLRFLHLDGSDLTSLDGLEAFPALHTITVDSTPIGDDTAALAAAAKKIKGAKLASFLCGIELPRKAKPAPKAKKQLVQALRDDTLDDESDLRKADLSGERFADLYITHDLRAANLANTVWERCDFEFAKLAGANLRGATFYDCDFDNIDFAKANAQQATFIGCGGALDFQRATLSGARLLDMAPDVDLDFTGSKADGMVLQASFCSEKEHAIVAKGADLRGAAIYFDVTADRKTEIKKKKTSRFAWSKTHLAGAKTDKTTHVHYAPLDGSAALAPQLTSAPSPGEIDSKGPAAKQLATLHAANASLWAIIADAADAAGWRGAVDETDKHDDFQRALRTKTNAAIAMGKANGVLAEIGTNGWSPIFQTAAGLLLVDYNISLDDRKQQNLALAQRVAQWQLPTAPKVFGKVTVRSGALAILLPYTSGAFTPKQLANAKAGKVYQEPNTYDRILIPVANGTYNIGSVPFRPVKDTVYYYEDEIGEYGAALTIQRAK